MTTRKIACNNCGDERGWMKSFVNDPGDTAFRYSGGWWKCCSVCISGTYGYVDGEPSPQADGFTPVEEAPCGRCKKMKPVDEGCDHCFIGSAQTVPNNVTTKPTNPKDSIGSGKVPLHLWPNTASVYGSMALLDGALKYGRMNYRAVGVRASIYYDAARRHLDAWFEGETMDPDSGLPHLAHVLACAAILVEATVKGNMRDDRNFPTNYRALMEGMTPQVEQLKEKYADRDPKHYTIEDTP